jgi:outer membrane lipoprotein SlyB
MLKHLKLGGIVVLAGALAACANTPLNSYGYSSGSQPVYAANNGGYQAPPPAYNDNNNTAYPPAGNNTAYNNTTPPPVYNSADGSTWGTVVRVDNLSGTARKDTGIGAVIGAGVGALVGNQIGRNINDAKTTGTVAGAIGGGVIGNAIERNQNSNAQMLRVYVRMDDGSERYWDVSSSQLQPGVGQRLRIQNDQLFAQ